MWIKAFFSLPFFSRFLGQPATPLSLRLHRRFHRLWGAWHALAGSRGSPDLVVQSLTCFHQPQHPRCPPGHTPPQGRPTCSRDSVPKGESLRKPLEKNVLMCVVSKTRWGQKLWLTHGSEANSALHTTTARPASRAAWCVQEGASRGRGGRLPRTLN